MRARHPGVRRGLRFGLLSTVAALGATAAIALTAGPAFPATRGASPARLHVGVGVMHFATAGRAVHGTGMITATLTEANGQSETTHSLVAFTAAASGHCQILKLVLNPLHLSLLGLNVDLSKVVLTITGIRSGQPGGGILGSLFCSLANSHLAADARASAARAIDAQMRHKNRLVRFTAFVYPVAKTAQAGATCPVLDLVVGPLHLNLLGLVVDLNKLHLTVTATQGGGVLGDLFCSLSTTSTTLPTTTTTTTP